MSLRELLRLEEGLLLRSEEMGYIGGGMATEAGRKGLPDTGLCSDPWPQWAPRHLSEDPGEGLFETSLRSLRFICTSI